MQARDLLSHHGLCERIKIKKNEEIYKILI
jgi:hypothetical protein